MKRIFIDLEKCYKCEKCVARCNYPYHPDNNGVLKLIEMGVRETVCRKCEDAPCINACPNEALERLEDGRVKRYNMRCTGCGTCVVACPFGVIFHEIITYYDSQCDFCEGREPLCVKTCPHGAIKYEEVEEEPEKRVYVIGDKFAVHAMGWER